MKTIVGLESFLPVSRDMGGFILSHNVFLYSTMKFYEHVPDDSPLPRSHRQKQLVQPARSMKTMQTTEVK